MLLWCRFLLVSLAAGQNPLQHLASVRKEMPSYLAKIEATLSSARSGEKPSILVVGDSWGDVVAAGSSVGAGWFESRLKKHGCRAASTNIAVPGTMASDWKEGEYLEKLKRGAKAHDYVWIVLMGNDALDYTQTSCKGKTAEECGDGLYQEMIAAMGQIVDAVHEANPAARVVGFGYDTMFGGLGCSLITHAMFPQCWGKGVPRGGGNACFNKQFLRIQGVWDDIASNRSWVDSASILGATQVAAGDPKASTGPDRHINMDKMGPAKYWPDYEGCFHPGVLGGDNSGAAVVMDEFIRVYWSDKLNCSKFESSIVV